MSRTIFLGAVEAMIGTSLNRFLSNRDASGSKITANVVPCLRLYTTCAAASSWTNAPADTRVAQPPRRHTPEAAPIKSRLICSTDP